MKNYYLSLFLMMTCFLAKAQDFSYVNAIDIEDETQYEEAAEAAMQCCCYLTAVRYDKKDKQREVATQFVKQWVEAKNTQDVMLKNVFEEDEDLQEMYIVFYAMNDLDEEGELKMRELQVAALEGVVGYCSNSSNKLKMTKELKEISKLINAGELEQSIINSTLTSSVD
ncbi:hypothetical protein J1N10_13820 [Carboxylicivirga sp. A043]|uniref:hypothetical protein n=1 Tax=Carboxylicivirga litoralis TaxID=2816963 RepID=UPI0021CB5A50|nr:hypothetical protein [Carboxylicivirga sp. A043]MCU4157063.1 hypothetical protein [Carboxylicivirga sp. A043]